MGLVDLWYNFLYGRRKNVDAVRSEAPTCETCEVLKEQLAFANYDRKMLLENFVRSLGRVELPDTVSDVEDHAPIRTGSKMKPWRVRQQELEAESRERAAMLKPTPTGPRGVTPESIERLESELGLQIKKEGNNGVQAVQEDEKRLQEGRQVQ